MNGHKIIVFISGVEIRDFVSQKLSEFSVTEDVKNVTFVTDSAANMIKAFDMSSRPNVKSRIVIHSSAPLVVGSTGIYRWSARFPAHGD